MITGATKVKYIYKIGSDRYNEIIPHYLNRSIKPHHVKTLTEQIKWRDLGASVPIVLNEHNMIIDGHHRYIARKDLGLPIYFVNHNGLVEQDIILLNINRSEWSAIEAGEFYNSLYEETGDEEWKDYPLWLDFYKSFVKRTVKVSNKMAIALLTADTTGGVNEFKEGKFKIKDYDDARKIAEFIIQCFKFTHKKQSESLARALWFLWRLDGFDPARFIELMSKKTQKFDTIAYMNQVEWWVKFIQDQILTYSEKQRGMTSWKKYNEYSDEWLTYAYSRTMKAKNQHSMAKNLTPSGKLKLDWLIK